MANKVLESLRVLVVDDDSESRKLMLDYLSDMGVVKAFEASGGQEALDFLEAARVDLVISDIRMTPMSGDLFVQALRRDAGNANKQVPVMMVTEDPDTSSIKAAKRAGVTSLVVKSSRFKEFHGHIMATLARAGMVKQEQDGLSPLGSVETPVGKAWD